MKQEKYPIEVKRHSASHLLARAVLNLYPKVKLGIGPAIENGFYYDFDFEEPISEEDLPKIEAEMRRLAREDTKFIQVKLNPEEALKKMADQPYKTELIKDLISRGEEQLSFYKNDEFIDLCSGPHVDSSREIAYFKLDKVAGAYWKGNENNKMLTRIYALAFTSQKELEKYLNNREEALKRDHRLLSRELDFFSQDESVGTGLILWHPNLSVVREEIELYWRREHRRRGYQYVYTPHIGRQVLWQKSGHTDHYRKLMYPPLIDDRGDGYYLKPMSCPFHMVIYNSRPRSYRELPLRWCELGTVYRYELEGVRHGILRPRGFTQDDAHIICTEDQIVEELEKVLDFAIEINQTFGFDKLYYELALRDPKDKEKYIGEDSAWKVGEDTLRKILDRRGVKYEEGIGEAKFYGPAIDLKVEDALGRKWQGTTIQFDFNLPERFDMEYVEPDGQKHRPYMIHRTILGSMERFIGTLIENYGGAFPAWLAPVQAQIIPISKEQNDYAHQLKEELKQIEQLSGPLRVVVDDRGETMQSKVRQAQEQKIPYMLIVGKREADKHTVNLRLRTEEKVGEIEISQAAERIKKAIETRSVNL